MGPGVIERSRANGAAHARRYPKKAARMLVNLRERDIPAALDRRDTLEVQRMKAIAEGIEEELSGDGEHKLCLRCGEVLQDTTQPGWEAGYGPTCWEKVEAARVSLPNYDGWLEPPDPESCDDGCVLEDPHDACWTRQDAKDEAALQRWEAEQDDHR